MFPSKKEMDEKEIQKQNVLSILATMDILRELDDANVIFNSNGSEIADAIQEDVASSENSSSVSATFERSLNDENVGIVAQTSNANKEVNESHEAGIEENEMYDEFIIDDFVDNNANNELAMNEENESFQDEAHFITFDEEHGLDTNIADFPAKQEDINEKGQLSSVIEDEDDKVNISRYTNIKKGQRIDFSYPGEGWVYLGEENSKKGLNYTKRKMENGKTFFSFKAEEEGNYILNFSYFDAFSGDFIVDAVSVKILPNEGATPTDSLVLDYQQKNGKKEGKNREEIVRRDVPISKEVVNQEGFALQNSQTSDKRTPQDVPIDSEKVGLKVQDDTKKSNVRASSEEKETISATSTKQEKMEKIDTKDKSETGKDEKLVKTGKQAAETSKKKDGRERLPSSKKEDKKTVYKEPEVVANIATLSVTNAGNKDVDETKAKEIIAQADASISSGDAEAALQNLENFFAIASNDIDKAYLLQGRAYELNGKRKNIKLALQSYKFLIKTFPNSEYRNLANERIRYIEKFFVNIK